MFGRPSTQAVGSRHSAFCGTHLVRSPVSTPQGLAAPLEIQAGLVGYGKKWEKLPVNKNNKVPRVPMHVRTGDHVVIIAGSDKGKTGDITQVCRKTGKVWVQGANLKLRYKAPEGENEPATTYRAEGPMHHSNVMHYSKEQQVRSRVKKKYPHVAECERLRGWF